MRKLVSNQSRKKLTDLAYKEIKDAIVTNQVKTGDLLSTNDIAKRLDISRTPVREAINILENEGFLEIRNGIGAFVRDVSIKELNDIFEVRKALEITALKNAINRIPISEIDLILEKWYECIKTLNESGDVSLGKINELDQQTHSLMIDNCDNKFLQEIMEGIKVKIQRSQDLSIRALDDSNNTIKQHVEILLYLRDRDLKKAINCLENHIDNSVLFILNSK